MSRRFREREVVVYEKWKHGPRPGPRAHDVRPSPMGEDYDYVIDKYWIVDRVLDQGRLVLRTPTGKRHEIDGADPCLRHRNLLERIWLFLTRRDRLRALREPSL